jgi:hydrogenase maturation protease
VLGLGNLLLGDDGFGPRVVEELALRWRARESVELLDGGTQGLGLLGDLSGRPGLLIVDAYRSGVEAGRLTLLESPSAAQLGARKSQTAHEGNAGELLSVAALSGDLPGRVMLLGVEPERIGVGIGLSPKVEEAIPRAILLAGQAVDKLRRSTVCV